MTAPIPEYLVQVTTHPEWRGQAFCAGMVWRGPWCIEAAPILRWAMGYRWEKFEAFCKRRGWQLHVKTLGGGS